MTARRSRRREALLPAGVFVAALAAHLLWWKFFPEQDPAQAAWAALPPERSWLGTYLEARAYWLGYAYALSFAFAAAAVRRFLRHRSRATRRLAVGGVTLSGALALAGCFLIGCCGSPMLAVWLGLFGAAFLPLAKPLVAVVTTVTVGLAWGWTSRAGPRGGETEWTQG